MSCFSAVSEALLLVVALSLDAFFACFSYGAGGIQIPRASACVINCVCTLVFAAGLLASALLGAFIPAQLAHTLAFVLLLMLGIAKCFDALIKSFIQTHTRLRHRFAFSMFSLNFILSVYAQPQVADRDRSMVLSPKEAAALALALSIDGLGVGFGVGFAGISIPNAILLVFCATALSVSAGFHLGNRMSRFSLNLDWLSGCMLILLAFLKL